MKDHPEITMSGRYIRTYIGDNGCVCHVTFPEELVN